MTINRTCAMFLAAFLFCSFCRSSTHGRECLRRSTLQRPLLCCQKNNWAVFGTNEAVVHKRAGDESAWNYVALSLPRGDRRALDSTRKGMVAPELPPMRLRGAGAARKRHKHSDLRQHVHKVCEYIRNIKGTFPITITVHCGLLRCEFACRMTSSRSRWLCC